MLSPPGQAPGQVFGLTALMLGLTLSLALLSPGAARADTFSGNNAARVSAYIKPCFGALIGAEYSMCGTGGRSSGRGYYGDDRFYSRFRGGVVAHFDCAQGNNALDRLLSRLPSGSTLYLRGQRGYRATNGLQGADVPDAYASYSICEVSLRLTKSIIIQPEMTGDYERHPLLVKAPQGEPCVRVESTADQVIVRNLTLISTRGTGSSCIESLGGDVTLENSNLRYDGDEAAVSINAGRFNMTDTNLIARTRSSALEVNHASLFISNSRIASTYNGIRGDLVGDSRLIGVTVMQLGDWQGFERGENARAVDVELTTPSSIITVDQMKTLFYGNGLYLGGSGEGLVSNSLFYSDHAVNSKLGKVRILNNYIFADEIGIDIEDGTAYVGNNHIRLVRTAGILKSPRAQLRSVNNHIATEKCESLSWGDVAPQDRSCTPWHQKSEFGIPGGGVDWSIYGILSEACGSVPQGPQAQNVCNNFRASTLTTKSKGSRSDNEFDYYAELKEICFPNAYGSKATYSTEVTKRICENFGNLSPRASRPEEPVVPRKPREPKATASTSEKAAYDQALVEYNKAVSSYPQSVRDYLADAYDYYGYDESSFRALKAVCTQSPPERIIAWQDACRDFTADASAYPDKGDRAYVQLDESCSQNANDKDLQVGKIWYNACEDFRKKAKLHNQPYEDDETNLDLTGGKEWLSQQLYANENNLYTMSSQTFMPLYDDYLPRPPYHAIKGSSGTQSSPDNAEGTFGAPAPRLPSSNRPAVPPSPAIPRDNSSKQKLDYNSTAR